jgi:hypothetical protein
MQHRSHHTHTQKGSQAGRHIIIKVAERGSGRCLGATMPRDADSAEAHCRAPQHALARRQAAESGRQKERERDTETERQRHTDRHTDRQIGRQADTRVPRMSRLPCTKKLPGRAWWARWARRKSDPCDMHDRRTEQRSVARTGTLAEVSGKGWKVSGCGEWKSHYLSGGASRARGSCPRLTATVHVDQSVRVQHSVLASSRRE